MAKRKVKIYTAEELLSMSKEEVIEIYNREAERRNKQITRARKRGITPRATGRRKSRLSKKTKISKEEIIKRYQETKAAGDVTIQGMIDDVARMYGNESAAFKAQLRALLDKNPGQFSAIYERYKNIMVAQATGELKSWREIYYETLKNAVETNRVKWFDEKTGTPWENPAPGDPDIMDEYRNMLAEILKLDLERILNNARN